MGDNPQSAFMEKVTAIELSVSRIEVEPVRMGELALLIGSEQLPVTAGAIVVSQLVHQLIGHPVLALDLARTMHTEHSIERQREIVEGELLNGSLKVTRCREMSTSRVLSCRIEITDMLGELVEVHTSSFMSSRGFHE